MRSAVIVGCCLIGLLAGLRPAYGQERIPADSSAARLTAYRDTLNIFAPEPYRLRPFVLPGSERVFVSGVRIDTAAYRLDYRWGRLWLRDLPPSGDARLVVVYRTLPFDFRDVYRLRGVAAADSAGGLRRVVEEERENAAESFDPFEGVTLEHSGSISRGVITGSNRDLVVESGLRLQLSGEITDGVSVRAVLTDENTPIQPSGTTQRLEDFDRVFIEVQAPQGTARLGDVDLDFDGSTFGQLSRKLQGATLTSDWTVPASPLVGKGQVQVAGAVSRGTYRVQEINALEGVQGPYRLEGREGERFILVIAGSETVYLDGERLTRGASNDYVIDYARGEITFTPKHLITAESRIRVEFEYRTSAFTRALLAAEGQVGLWQRSDGTARLRLGAAFIREADDRSLAEAFGSTPVDSSRLVGAGDGLALRSGAERVPFDPEAPYVQYRRERRARPDGMVDTVFVALQSVPPDSVAVYRVRFTRVGEGQGSYVRVGRAVNGILYEYRGPGQGAYAPILRLPRPNQHRLFDLHAEIEPLSGLTFFGEWAGSLNDENRLSRLDAGDDQGTAYRVGVRLDSTDVGIGRLSLTYRRTFRGRNFRPFVRTRPVEFDRRWNLTGLALDPTGGIQEIGHEQTDVAKMALAFSPRSRLEAEVGRLALGSGFVGWRRAVEGATAETGWPHLDYRLEYITSRNPFAEQEGSWIRQLGAVRQPLLDGRLVPYVEVEHERRLLNVAGADSLARPSFSFIEYRPGLDYRAERFIIGAEVELRRMDEAAAGRMRDASAAWTVQTHLQYHPSDIFNTKARIGLRSVEFTEYFQTKEGREGRSSVVIRSQSELRLFDGGVDVEGFYEALTERTPTLQEIYLKVGPTLGQYVWQDADGDSLMQIDEFIPERTPNEGTYVQRFVPSDSLSPVIDVQARLRLHLDPARRWRYADARWKRWLAKVETQTILEVRERNRTDDLAQIYLLNLSRFRQPGLTQNGSLHIGQTFYFFRGAPRYGLDLSFNQVRSLSDRAAGTQRRFVNAWRLEGRYRLSPVWSLRASAALERERLMSNRFASRTYDIRSLRLHPEVVVNLSRTAQLTAGLVFAKKRDRLGGRQARVWRGPVELRLARAQRLQLTLRIEAAHVQLQGDATGLALYELTEGRGPGTSLAWGVNGQYAINDYLRATLAYDGRAFAGEPVLHTARLSLSASF